jgi:putative Holliday junction resolvase
MKIMAIDYGSSSVGVALTDPLAVIAQPYLTIKYSTKRSLIDRLKSIIRENEVRLVLIGNPISHQGTATALSEEVAAFADKLAQSTGIEVKLWDERLTSKYADARLRELGMTRRQRAKKIDQVAAAIILEEYLQSCLSTA